MGEKRYFHIGRLRRLIVHALLNGAKTKSFYRYEWNVAGRCTDPQHIEIEGREYSDREVINPRNPQLLEMHVKCRRCANCRWERQMSWTTKAIAEYEMAQGRTWFVTLTMCPAAHHKMVARAATRLHKGGTNLDALGVVERFEEHVIEAGKELTKFFKRLRKNYSAPLRYIVVAEPHKSGLPHYHVLIHEQDPRKPLLKKHIVTEWQLGFTKAKLVHDKWLCGYVAKYLGKMKTTRVRASLNYGTRKGEALPAPSPGHALQPSEGTEASDKTPLETTESKELLS